MSQYQGVDQLRHVILVTPVIHRVVFRRRSKCLQITISLKDAPGANLSLNYVSLCIVYQLIGLSSVQLVVFCRCLEGDFADYEFFTSVKYLILTFSRVISLIFYLVKVTAGEIILVLLCLLSFHFSRKLLCAILHPPAD